MLLLLRRNYVTSKLRVTRRAALNNSSSFGFSGLCTQAGALLVSDGIRQMRFWDNSERLPKT